jgi:23S rRNA (uridine2552-2'-O)-methyltransferase
MAYKPHDAYYKKAKQEGYRSRAAYKLLELQERFRVIRPGDLVVDLGAAPGGWLQVAAKLAGPTGKVLGIDLQPVAPFGAKHILLVQGDITFDQTHGKVKELLGGPADCVISDLAPKLSGIRDADSARSLELNSAALRLGGSFLVKSFMGTELETFSAELKRHFRSVQRTRPEATRRGSSEIYFCAKNFSSGRDHQPPLKVSRDASV